MVATPNFSDTIPSDLSNHSMQFLSPLQNFLAKSLSVVQKTQNSTLQYFMLSNTPHYAPCLTMVLGDIASPVALFSSTCPGYVH